jgi:hypothetical protein
MKVSYQQIADYNPFMISKELEDSLNRNQRDVLDWFMMCGENKEPTVYDLIDYCRFIKRIYNDPYSPSVEDCRELYQVMKEYYGIE